MLLYTLALLLPLIPSSAGSVLRVDGDNARAIITDAFTAVAIDICALKDGLDFSDAVLIKAAGHLSGTVLRVGGTDQNDFTYDMNSDKPMDCRCHKPCTMTAPYWKSVSDGCGTSECYNISAVLCLFLCRFAYSLCASITQTCTRIRHNRPLCCAVGVSKLCVVHGNASILPFFHSSMLFIPFFHSFLLFFFFKRSTPSWKRQT